MAGWARPPVGPTLATRRTPTSQVATDAHFRARSVVPAPHSGGPPGRPSASTSSREVAVVSPVALLALATGCGAADGQIYAATHTGIVRLEPGGSPTACRTRWASPSSDLTCSWAAGWDAVKGTTLRSDDNGRTWNSGASLPEVGALAADPDDSLRVVAATGRAPQAFAVLGPTATSWPPIGPCGPPRTRAGPGWTSPRRPSVRPSRPAAAPRCRSRSRRCRGPASHRCRASRRSRCRR